jgi:malate dehydrogenase (oxaloacetate-decarboxylating)(NADP+)
MKGRIAEVLRNWPERDVRFICVSTGGRILGLGDIGANGMGIPIGKLQLYTACAAVPPSCLLPVLLDIGTTNAALRADPLYLGLREQPPSEKELDELVEEFVQAVKANDDGLTLKDAALQSGDIDEKQFDQIVNPRKMVGHGVGGS